MRFLDLIKQYDGMRVFRDRFGQQTTLVITDIAWRRAYQARHRMPFHVLGHVETHQLDAHRHRQLTRHFGFAYASWAREQEHADRLVVFAQARS